MIHFSIHLRLSCLTQPIRVPVYTSFSYVSRQCRASSCIHTANAGAAHGIVDISVALSSASATNIGSTLLSVAERLTIVDPPSSIQLKLG